MFQSEEYCRSKRVVGISRQRREKLIAIGRAPFSTIGAEEIEALTEASPLTLRIILESALLEEPPNLLTAAFVGGIAVGKQDQAYEQGCPERADAYAQVIADAQAGRIRNMQTGLNVV